MKCDSCGEEHPDRMFRTLTPDEVKVLQEKGYIKKPKVDTGATYMLSICIKCLDKMLGKNP